MWGAERRPADPHRIASNNLPARPSHGCKSGQLDVCVGPGFVIHLPGIISKAMDPKSRAGIVFLLVIVLAPITAAPAGAQGIFTVQAGSTTTPPLVSRNETWNFFK